MGFFDALKRLFGIGPSREELARQEREKRELEAAARAQAGLQAKLSALEEENRHREEALRLEREARERTLEQERRKAREDMEKRLKERERELTNKYSGLLEKLEKKMDMTVKEREERVRRMEEQLQEKVQAIISEQDKQIEAAFRQKTTEDQELEDELQLLDLEKEMLEDEQKKLKEKAAALSRKEEEIRIARTEARFGGPMKGLGMSEGERAALEAVLGTYTFDNFVVGPNNRFPREAAFTVAKSPANAYNPLFIYSKVGLGKTHLLCAIGNYIASHHKKLRIAYLTTERFTNELLQALSNARLDEFRTRYRNVDVLLIDDIQFLGKQEQTQTEFFHTFNSLYNDHKQIVLASDRPPKEIATLESRLQSRFEGGLITEIKTPEFPTRLHIITEKARDEEMEVCGDVLEFLASSISSNIRTLLGALNRVTAYARLTGEKCTVAMASEVLKDVLAKETGEE